MNNKGFTMVELIAIIAILAAIFLISFPLLNSMNSTDKQKEYELMVKNLCESGRSYIYSDTTNYPNISTIGSEIRINVSDLVEYGNVSSRKKNPNTGNTILDDTLVYTVSSNSYLECEYIDN